MCALSGHLDLVFKVMFYCIYSNESTRRGRHYMQTMRRYGEGGYVGDNYEDMGTE